MLVVYIPVGASVYTSPLPMCKGVCWGEYSGNQLNMPIYTYIRTLTFNQLITLAVNQEETGECVCHVYHHEDFLARCNVINVTRAMKPNVNLAFIPSLLVVYMCVGVCWKCLGLQFVFR